MRIPVQISLFFFIFACIKTPKKKMNKYANYFDKPSEEWSLPDFATREFCHKKLRNVGCKNRTLRLL